MQHGGGDRVERKDLVDAARENRGARHAEVLRSRLVLGENPAPRALQGGRTRGSVDPGAREDDRGARAGVILRERKEEDVGAGADVVDELRVV